MKSKSGELLLTVNWINCVIYSCFSLCIWYIVMKIYVRVYGGRIINEYCMKNERRWNILFLKKLFGIINQYFSLIMKKYEAKFVSTLILQRKMRRSKNLKKLWGILYFISSKKIYISTEKAQFYCGWVCFLPSITSESTAPNTVHIQINTIFRRTQCIVALHSRHVKDSFLWGWLVVALHCAGHCRVARFIQHRRAEALAGTVFTHTPTRNR